MEDIMQGTGNTTDDSSSGNVPLELPTDVRWGFTREGLYAYRHYQHWIPITKQLHVPFMNENWPGLSWNEAAALLREAGVWIKDSTHFSGHDVRSDVQEFHILHDGTTRIVSFAENETLPTATPSRWQGGGLPAADRRKAGEPDRDDVHRGVAGAVAHDAEPHGSGTPRDSGTHRSRDLAAGPVGAAGGRFAPGNRGRCPQPARRLSQPTPRRPARPHCAVARPDKTRGHPTGV